MQAGSPYHVVEALGSCQVGTVWSAVDAAGGPLTVAVLNESAASDQRWRDAFAAAANALAQPQGGARVAYADFSASAPWVAYVADGGSGAERVFLALGMDYQPVPPDFDDPVAPMIPRPPAPPAEQAEPVAAEPPADPHPATAQPTQVLPVVAMNPWAAPAQDAAPPPAQPVSPAQPAQPVSPAQPAQPVSPAPPAQPVSPAPPAQPVSPAPPAPAPAPAPAPPVVAPGPAQPVAAPAVPPQPPAPARPAPPTPYPADADAFAALTPSPDQPRYFPPRDTARAERRRRRTTVRVAIAALAVLVLAGGGTALAWQGLGGDDTPDPQPANTTASGPVPTTPPLRAGLEPPRPGDWPTQWPKFGGKDKVRVLTLDGLGFPLTVPANWDCVRAGSAEGYVKYNCGASPAENVQLGGELIVRDCPAPCDRQRQDAMRKVEEAWGQQWRYAGQNTVLAETLRLDGAERYGLVLIAYPRSTPGDATGRQIVLRMTSPVDWLDDVRKVANGIRDSGAF